jgi:hypothetical protein
MRSEHSEHFAAGFDGITSPEQAPPGLGNEQEGYQAHRARSLASLGGFALPPCWFPFIGPPFVVEVQKQSRIPGGFASYMQVYHRYPILGTHPFYVGGPCPRLLSSYWLIWIKTVILARDRDSGVSLRNNLEYPSYPFRVQYGYMSHRGPIDVRGANEGHPRCLLAPTRRFNRHCAA